MHRIRPPHKDTLVCALLCFACALLSLGFYMLQDGGAFTIREDFDFQQLPFTMALHNQIARGGLAGWCWNLDLGASAIQGFGFYELGSPFFWTSMLFSADAFPYVVGWLYIAKYVVAGVTSFWFLSRFVSNSQSALVGALLYAFSGFQTANLLFYHFHDVVALFPLLLIGLERLMENDRDWIPFVLATFINALVNYFFFVQSFVFLLLYFGFRFGPSLWKEGRQRLLAAVGRCFALGILGVAMAGALLVPSAYYMLSNPRAGSSAFSLSRLVWDPVQFLFQVQGFLLPADAMFDHNALIAEQWTSTSCWLPMVGPTLALAYLRKRRDWLTRLLMALLVFCLSPILTSAFIFFTDVYQRWWYCLVLMAALASAQVVNNPEEFDVGSSARIIAGCVCVLVLITVLASSVLGANLLFHPERFFFYVGIALSGIGLTAFFARRVQTSFSSRASIAFICAFAIGSTALTLHFYRQNLLTGELLNNISAEEQHMGTLNAIELGTQLQELDSQYRYATGDNRLTLTGKAVGVSSFSSTICSATSRLETFFDSPATNVWHLNKSTIPGLSELLGAKYRIVTNVEKNDEIVNQHIVDGKTYYVVAKEALPLGALYEHYQRYEDAFSLPVEQRAQALLQAPVVSEEDEHVLAGYTLAAQAEESPRTVQNFWRNDYGFGFNATCEKPMLAYVSVPHDDGWSCSVDGVQTTIVDSAGMMLVPLDSGEHEVAFSYATPGLRIGIAVSAIAWLLFAALAARRLVQ